jgi:chromosome segregation ATPase
MSTGDSILVALQKLEGNLFENLRAEMGRQLDGFRLEINARFDAIEVRLERLETEYHMIVAALRRIEGQLSHERDDRARLKAELSSLKTRVTELQQRIHDIEARLDEQ